MTGKTKDYNIMVKKLYRITHNKKVAGVCSGIADYFDIDPTLVRLGWIMAICCCGSGLLAYIIAWIVIPEQPQEFITK